MPLKIIIFIGICILLYTTITNYKKEKTAGNTVALVVCIVMLIASLILLLDLFI